MKTVESQHPQGMGSQGPVARTGLLAETTSAAAASASASAALASRRSLVVFRKAWPKHGPTWPVTLDFKMAMMVSNNAI